MTQICFVSLLALSIPFELNAQTVKMINSTEQSWSGGIAGKSGANYTFVVEFSDYSSEPVPDTVWIGNEPFDLIISDSTIDYGNTKRTRLKKAVRYSFDASIIHDEYPDRYAPPPPDSEPKAAPANPPMPYKGVGLLSYRYKGKEHYYTIGKIISVLEPANYP